MEILIYFLKASIFLVVFYAFYFGFFKNETFHKANRYFLVVGAIVALTLPFFKSTAIQNTKVIPSEIQDVAYEWYFESEDIVVSPAVETYSYFDVFKFLYLTGLILAITIFLVRFIKTFVWFKSNKNTQGIAFSFFGKIFIDQNLEQKSVVFKHENIHVEQRHFLDLIFFEILQIVFWFNPVVYFYKKSICIIHEFLADEAASKIAQDKVAYASLLVSKQFSIQPVTIFTQHFFNHSTLKSRIIMLSKNPSKKTTLLKYGLLAPAFFVMLVISSFTVVNESKVENILTQIDKKIHEKLSNEPQISDNQSTTQIEPLSKFEDIQSENSIENLPLNFLPNNKESGIDESRIEDFQIPTSKFDTIEPKTNPKVIFTSVEQNPEFIGGQAELYKWLAKNIKYPLEAKNNKIEGRVFVKFVIEANGEIGDVKVMKGIGYGCDEEAARVLKNMPKWKPGYQNGRAVAVYYNMPIVFKWNKNVLDETMLLIDHDESLGSRKFTYISYPSSKNKSPKFKIGLKNIHPIIVIDNQIINDTRGIDLRFNNSDYESFKYIDSKKATSIYGEIAKDGAVILFSKKNRITIKSNESSSSQTRNSKINKVAPFSSEHFEVVPVEKNNLSPQNLLHDDTKPVEKLNLLRNDKEPNESYSYLKSSNGITTLNGSKAKPMVFVDGKELFLGMDGLSSVKPETIESISVIKEPAKLQLYGERAKDGVILIKTKTNFIKTDDKK